MPNPRHWRRPEGRQVRWVPALYYPTTFLGRQPKKEAYFKLRFRLKLIGLGWNRLNLWL